MGVSVQTRPNGSRVAIGQSSGTRRDRPRQRDADGYPIAVLFPCSCAGRAVIRSGFRPCRGWRRAGSKRTDHLEKLPTEACRTSFCRLSLRSCLLDRIAGYVHQQRRFIADAAHELRTPITALTFRSRMSSMATDNPDVGSALRFEGRGRRSARLLEQLLTLARYDGCSTAVGP